MKFSLFWQVPGHEGSTVPVRHWETIEEITLGEKLGFHEAWLAESPFYPTRPMSQPLFVISAAAQHTSNIRFGTLATQTPMHHPIEYATSAATCEIMTKGRLDLCLGGRYGGASSNVMGISDQIDSDQSRRMVREFTNILRSAWKTDRLNFDGEFWKFQDVPVLPKPLQEEGPPLLMAANSDGSFAFAAHQNMGVIGTTLSQSLSNIKNHAVTFSKIFANNDYLDPQPFHLAVSFFVADTKEKARQIMSRNWLDTDVIASGPPVHSTAIGGGRHDFSSGEGGWGTWDFQTATQHCIYDSPEGCVEKLREVQEKVPTLDQCILEFNRRGRLTSKEVQDSMKLFADRVMPEFS
jgi:alkanesulfonate monooxygenase SsuD/methylene tetrahydromethanopterin reductase-like flavin-dependent oxidoreductase (luciferase family)